MFCVIPPGSFVFIFKSVTEDQNYIQVKINLTTSRLIFNFLCLLALIYEQSGLADKGNRMNIV